MSDIFDNFIFSAKPGGPAPSYEQLQMRRKIAQAMLGQKRAYPKTLGEGLTSVGENLADIAYMKNLESADQAREADVKKTMEPLLNPQASSETAPTTLPPSTRNAMAYAADEDTADLEGPSIKPASVPPVAATVTPPTQAPPIRDEIAAQLTPQVAPSPQQPLPQASMAPPQQPPQASLALPPLTPPAGPPAMAGPPPDQRMASLTPQAPPMTMTDIPAAPPIPSQIRPAPVAAPPPPQQPPVQLAQAGPPPSVPIPPSPYDQIRAPQTEPRPPVPPPPTPKMMQITRALGMVSPQDPRHQQLQQLYANEALQQKREFDQANTIYERDLAAYRGSPKAAQELITARKAADIATRFGGPEAYGAITTDIKDKHGQVSQLVNGLPRIKEAQAALKDAYTGTGAEAKLDVQKFARALGAPGDYSNAESTEFLKSRLKAIAASMVKSTVGSQNISDRDIDFVTKAAAGDISLEAGTIKRLLNASWESSVKSINDHNDRVLGIWNNPKEDAAPRTAWRIPMPYGADEAKLRQQPDAQEAFDRRYGKGHARAVLRGVPYGD